MILAVDMGNSNIVVGGLDDQSTYFEERITTDDRKTSLEYAIMLKNILEIHKVKRSDIEGSIISSVVPPLNAPLSSAVKKITGKRPFLVGSGMKTGLNIKMDNPKAVGGDRIVAAVAAIAKYEGPIIIIDMGTATTMDVVDKAGSYIGGVILPGVKVSLNSLVSNTAQLPRIKKYHRVYEKRHHVRQRRHAGRAHRPDGGRIRRTGDSGGHWRHVPVHHSPLHP